MSKKQTPPNLDRGGVIVRMEPHADYSAHLPQKLGRLKRRSVWLEILLTGSHLET